MSEINVIKMARDLGAEIQKSDAYKDHIAATEGADKDEVLQKLIEDFNEKKTELSLQAQNPEQNPEKMAELNNSVKELYAGIMDNENMRKYNESKADMDKILNFVQQIVVYSANGEDPYAVQEEVQGGCCGSDGCSSCSGGCH